MVLPAWFRPAGRGFRPTTESRAASPLLPSRLMDSEGDVTHRSSARDVFRPDETKARRSVRAAEHTAVGAEGMSLVAADRDSLQVRVGGGSRVQDPDVTIQGWEEEKRKRRCLSVCRLLPTETPKLRPHFTPQNNFYR